MKLSRLEPARSQLVLVDIQERLLAAMPEADAARVVRNAEHLLDAARLLGIPVVVTEQYPKGLGRTAPPLAAKVASLARALTVEKMAFDASDSEAFLAALDQGRDHIAVFGLEAHICVYQTVRGLRARGRTVAVVTDATASRNPANHALAAGLWEGVGARVLPTETLLFDWLRSAEHAAFRDISKLLK